MAKYADGFITISEKAPTISKLIDNLENVWIQNGKNINQMDRTIYLTVNINEDKKKSKEESDKFIKSYYGLNFWEETWGPFGTPEEVIQENIRKLEARYPGGFEAIRSENRQEGDI